MPLPDPETYTQQFLGGSPQSASQPSSQTDPESYVNNFLQQQNQPQQPGIMQRIGTGAQAIGNAVISPIRNLAGDLTSSFNSGIEGNAANTLAQSQQDLANVQAANAKKYTAQGKTDLANQETAGVNQYLNSAAPTTAVANDPQFNRTIEQGLGDVLGTGALALSGGSLEGLSPIGRILSNIIGGGVVGGSSALSNNQDAQGVAQDTLKSAAISGLLSSVLEGIGGIKNSLRSEIGATDLGQVAGNPSRDVTAGLLGKPLLNTQAAEEAGQNASDYHTNLATATNQAGNIITDPIQDRVNSVLSREPAAGGFNIKPVQVDPSDLAVMNDYVNNTGQGRDFTTGQAQSVYQKIFGSPDQDVVDQIKSIVGRSVDRFRDISNPTDDQMSKAFQYALGHNGNIGLDFSGSSGIIPGSKGARSILDAYQRLTGTGGTADVGTLDGLKQQIRNAADQLSTEKDGKSQVVLGQMARIVEDELVNKSPAYSTAMSAYPGYLAGKSYSAPILNPTNIGSSLLSPKGILGLGNVSPRALGGLVRVVGQTNQKLGALGTVGTSNIIRSSPTALSEILRTIGVLH